MKEKIENFKNKIKKLFSKSDIEDRGYAVGKNWYTALSFSVFLAIIFCFVGVYALYFAADYSRQESDLEHLTSISFNADYFNDVVVRYSEKNKQFIELRGSVTKVSDPGPLPEVSEEEEFIDINEGVLAP